MIICVVNLKAVQLDGKLNRSCEEFSSEKEILLLKKIADLEAAFEAQANTITTYVNTIVELNKQLDKEQGHVQVTRKAAAL